MIGKILLVFTGLFVQEIISINAIIFATQHGVYPVLFTHVTFVVATIFDMGIGYWIGSVLRRRTSRTRVGTYVQKLSEKFSLDTKKYRRWTALFILGNLSFPYVNACIGAYLDLPFWESAFFIFVGNVVWYVCDWFIVAGVSSVIKNVYIAFAVVIGIAVVVAVILRSLNAKKV